MNNTSLTDLAKMIKHYSLRNSSRFLFGALALTDFLESQGFHCVNNGISVLVYDSNCDLVVKV